MNYFGTTEVNEIAFIDEKSWVPNLYDGNIIITKHLNKKLIEILTREDVMNKVILHHTVTGMAGTPIEPLTPSIESAYVKYRELMQAGFPKEQYVLRIDPMIPTLKGLQTVKNVIKRFFIECPPTRMRLSFMDMYPHVVDRFKQAGIIPPYSTFEANQKDIDTFMVGLHEILSSIHMMEKCSVESCAESKLSQYDWVNKCGCVSQKDVDILGLTDKYELVGQGKQRKNCGCPNNKKNIVQLSGAPHQCENACLYCFWKNGETKIKQRERSGGIIGGNTSDTLVPYFK